MSIHEILHRKEVDEAVEKPEERSFFYEVLAKLKAGYYDQEWVDVVLQKWDRFCYDIYDAAAFAKVWYALLDGEILHVKVGVGACPAPNDQTDENISRLAQLPAPFGTSMLFGLADQDGFLFWRKPIRLAKSKSAEIVDYIELPAGGGAPIEVGYTQSSRTLMHLAEYGCIARWPYDQDYIILLWRHPNRSEEHTSCDPGQERGHA